MSEITQTKNSIDNIIASVGELPASPAIVSSLMNLTSDLDSDVEEISKVLSSDQSLTAKVLKLSNSSYYGRAGGVKTLDQAIMILGFAAVQSMVLATSAHSMYVKDDIDGSKAKLWRHSLSVAIAARQIGAFIKFPQRDELFVAALLHDIGKLVLLQNMPGEYKEIISEVEQNKSEFYRVEQDKLGFTHCQVATCLLDKWGFPESLIENISQHHKLQFEKKDKVTPAHIINLANYLAKKSDVGFNDIRVENLSELNSAKLLNLCDADLEEIFEQFEEHYNAEKGIFEES